MPPGGFASALQPRERESERSSRARRSRDDLPVAARGFVAGRAVLRSRPERGPGEAVRDARMRLDRGSGVSRWSLSCIPEKRWTVVGPRLTP